MQLIKLKYHRNSSCCSAENPMAQKTSICPPETTNNRKIETTTFASNFSSQPTGYAVG